MPKNWCFWTVVLEKTLESPLDCKEIQPVHPKGDQSWISIRRIDAEAETPILFKEVTHLKRPCCWERLKVGGEGNDRGCDAWMASPTQWTWVWVNPGSWWWTERPGVLRFMGSHRVGHDWATELNWTELNHKHWFYLKLLQGTLTWTTSFLCSILYNQARLYLLYGKFILRNPTVLPTTLLLFSSLPLSSPLRAWVL